MLAPGARANGLLRAAVCLCVWAHVCGQDTGGGSGVGHPAAGEGQRTALSQEAAHSACTEGTGDAPAPAPSKNMGSGWTLCSVGDARAGAGHQEP